MMYRMILSVLTCATVSAFGQTSPVITHFDGSSGELVFTEVSGVANYYAEQLTDLSGSWTNVGGALDSIAPSGSGSVTCSVPFLVAPYCFYRISGELMNAPDGMVLIPAGTNSGTDPDFGTYSLTVDALYMDATEVTKTQWDITYNWALEHGYSFDHAGLGKATNHPVQNVDWFDCVKWCNARSQMEGETPCYTIGGSVYKTGQSVPDCNKSASGYRLPISTEWEYAARGGHSSRRFPWGDTITHNDANYLSRDNRSYDLSLTRGHHPDYDEGTTPFSSPAASFSANGYGLYDMSGNVSEFCNDWHPGDEGSLRVFRGGGYATYSYQCRSGASYGLSPYHTSNTLGFRSVRRAN